jgi:hypothetical protein
MELEGPFQILVQGFSARNRESEEESVGSEIVTIGCQFHQFYSHGSHFEQCYWICPTDTPKVLSKVQKRQLPPNETMVDGVNLIPLLNSPYLD